MSESPNSLTPEALLEHQDWMRALVRRLVRDENRVDDVLQETWLRVLQTPPRSPHAFRDWFRTLVRRHLRDSDKADAGRTRREQSVAASEAGPSTEEFVFHEMARRQVSDAILELPEPYRSVVILRYYDGLPPRHVAQRLGISVASVHSRLRHAHEELRRRLDREYNGDRRAWCLALIPLFWPPPLLWRITTRAKLTLDRSGVWNGKTVAVATTLVVAFLGFRLWQQSNSVIERGETEFSSRGTTPESPKAVPGRVPPTNPATVLLPRQPSTPANDTVGSLVVEVTWAEDGSPAADVGVSVIATRAPNPFEERRQSATDAQGRARFDGLCAGKALIYLDRGGNRDAEIELGQSTTVPLPVPRGFTVEGVVIDDYMNPIPGAKIRLSEFGNVSWIRDVTESRADGTFEIRSVGDERYIGASARGYAPSKLRFLDPEVFASRPIRIQLHAPGGELSGTVRDANGSPIDGAVVMIGCETPDSMWVPGQARMDWAAPPVRIATSTGGRYRADGLSLGRIPIAVRAPGYAPWSGAVEVSGETPTACSISLTVGATLVGTASEADGRPAHDCQIEVGGTPHDFLSSSILTNERGSFELAGIPLGGVEVRAIGTNGRVASTKLHAEAGQVIRWDATLAGGREIMGQVIDDSGNPLPDWLVTALPEPSTANRPEDSPSMPFPTTDESGQFVISNCHDAFYRISVIPPKRTGWASYAHPDAIRPSAEKMTVIVPKEVRAPAFITGSVLDPEGRPLGGVAVTVDVLGAGDSAVRRTDRDAGSYAIGPIFPSSVRLSLKSSDFGSLITETHQLEPGEKWDAGSIQLQTPGVAVVTIGPEGIQPIQYWSLWLRNAEGSVETSWKRDAAGNCRSGPLQPGRYSIRFDDPRQACMGRDFEIERGSETKISMTLYPAVRCDVDVRWPPGASRFHTLWFVVHQGDEQVVLQCEQPMGSNNKESFKVGLPLGHYTIEAKTDTGLSAEDAFSIVDLTTSSLNKTLDLH